MTEDKSPEAMSNITEEEKQNIIKLASDMFPPAVPSAQMRQFAFRAGAEWGIDHARKELAELKAENEKLKKLVDNLALSVSAENYLYMHKQNTAQAETLKRYKDALEFFLEMFKVSNDKYTEWVGTKEMYDAVIKAKSALSGTKETE